MNRNEQENKVSDFLRKFGTSNVVLTSSGKTNMSPVSLSHTLVKNREDECDSYFVVNPGGTKGRDIKSLTCFFVDIDAGRDKQKKYYKGAALSSRKTKILKAVRAFQFKPHFVVETRNGYQVYWLINHEKATALNMNVWKTVQKRLNNAFASVGADAKVMKPNQIMRLPYTWWHKKWENAGPSFMTKLSKHRPVTLLYNLKKFADDTKGMSSAITYIDREAWSYKRTVTPKLGEPKGDKASDWANREHTPSASNDDANLLVDLVAFLRDVNFFLWGKGAKFMAQQANQLVGRISKEFAVS